MFLNRQKQVLTLNIQIFLLIILSLSADFNTVGYSSTNRSSSF
ncbi:hypothetical protein LSH36_1424g00029 [Paralvinella palmiformis]|uniref:Uncharacterized protein n=1 Tax=Paralvinella palmiformis TaxID=53620 RepID=A0AAD9MQP9_9ANNE|nr:hypothetical protein LSH36_1424g00029 [Paralvinella palmiformis]